ncbi:MAG: TetR/AcrR family transcriptional regulator [Vagococcus sp.]|uniref:TetR/AcrR family transcriptional regulator n=1 Tax=Vagococcus sp. TaxID=1933889 RepID=UPI002FC66716
MPKVSSTYIENRQEKIIIAARSVFAQKGFTGATMKDVLETASISRGGLYAYFKNIEELFIAVLKYDDLENATIFTVKSDISSFYREYNKKMFQIFDELDSGVNLSQAKSEFLLTHDKKSYPYLGVRVNELKETMSEFFKDGQKKQFVSKNIDTYLFSETLLSMIDGILIHESSTPSTKKNRQMKITSFLEMTELYLKKG